MSFKNIINRFIIFSICFITPSIQKTVTVRSPPRPTHQRETCTEWESVSVCATKTTRDCVTGTGKPLDCFATETFLFRRTIPSCPEGIVVDQIPFSEFDTKIHYCLNGGFLASGKETIKSMKDLKGKVNFLKQNGDNVNKFTAEAVRLSGEISGLFNLEDIKKKEVEARDIAANLGKIKNFALKYENLDDGKRKKLLDLLKELAPQIQSKLLGMDENLEAVLQNNNRLIDLVNKYKGDIDENFKQFAERVKTHVEAANLLSDVQKKLDKIKRDRKDPKNNVNAFSGNLNRLTNAMIDRFNENNTSFSANRAEYAKYFTAVFKLNVLIKELFDAQQYIKNLVKYTRDCNYDFLIIKKQDDIIKNKDNEAKAEAERQKQAKLEQERLKAIEMEKEKEKQLELQRKQQEEAEALRKQKEERERAEEAARLQKQKEEAAREERERKAAEEARLKKEEEERRQRQKEEEKRKQRERETEEKKRGGAAAEAAAKLKKQQEDEENLRKEQELKQKETTEALRKEGEKKRIRDLREGLKKDYEAELEQDAEEREREKGERRWKEIEEARKKRGEGGEQNPTEYQKDLNASQSDDLTPPRQESAEELIAPNVAQNLGDTSLGKGSENEEEQVLERDVEPRVGAQESEPVTKVAENEQTETVDSGVTTGGEDVLTEEAVDLVSDERGEVSGEVQVEQGLKGEDALPSVVTEEQGGEEETESALPLPNVSGSESAQIAPEEAAREERELEEKVEPPSGTEQTVEGTEPISEFGDRLEQKLTEPEEEKQTEEHPASKDEEEGRGNLGSHSDDQLDSDEAEEKVGESKGLAVGQTREAEIGLHSHPRHRENDDASMEVEEEGLTEDSGNQVDVEEGFSEEEEDEDEEDALETDGQELGVADQLEDEDEDLLTDESSEDEALENADESLGGELEEEEEQLEEGEETEHSHLSSINHHHVSGHGHHYGDDHDISHEEEDLHHDHGIGYDFGGHNLDHHVRHGLHHYYGTNGYAQNGQLVPDNEDYGQFGEDTQERYGVTPEDEEDHDHHDEYYEDELEEEEEEPELEEPLEEPEDTLDDDDGDYHTQTGNILYYTQENDTYHGDEEEESGHGHHNPKVELNVVNKTPSSGREEFEEEKVVTDDEHVKHSGSAAGHNIIESGIVGASVTCIFILLVGIGIYVTYNYGKIRNKFDLIDDTEESFEVGNVRGVTNEFMGVTVEDDFWNEAEIGDKN